MGGPWEGGLLGEFNFGNHQLLKLPRRCRATTSFACIHMKSRVPYHLASVCSGRLKETLADSEADEDHMVMAPKLIRIDKGSRDCGVSDG